MTSDFAVPDLSDLNPYPEKQYRLHQLWNECFRIGWRGESFPKPDEDVYDDSLAERACLRGYNAGLQHGRDDGG